MNPEILTITENIVLNVSGPDTLLVTPFESVTVSEEFDPAGVLIQTGIAIITGRTYRLTFNADLSSGFLKVYQGTQQIYDTRVTPLSIHEMVYIADPVTIIKNEAPIRLINLSDTVTIAEDFQMILASLKPSRFDSVTITESVTLSVV